MVRSYEEIHQLGLLSSNEYGRESDNTRVVFGDSYRLCFQPVQGDSEFGSAGFQEFVVVSPETLRSQGEIAEEIEFVGPSRPDGYHRCIMVQ